MVLIDGHDCAWRKKFQIAAAAFCGDSQSLTSLPQRRKTTASPGFPDELNSTASPNKEQNTRKIVFMHLNLHHVAWEQLPLQGKSRKDTRNSSYRSDGYSPPKPSERYKFLDIQVIDCTGLESGLPYIFQLPLQHLYVSCKIILNGILGLVFSSGLQDSNRTLERLQLSSVTFTPDAMREFANGLEAAASLQELNLSYCLFQRFEEDHPVGNNDDRNTANTNQNPDVERNADTCVQLLARGIARSSIFCLRMNRSQLKDRHVAMLLGQGVCQCENMQELYLGGNTVGDRGLSALEKYLGSSKGCSLVTLGLSNTVRGEAEESKETSETIVSGSCEKLHPFSRLYPALAANRSLRVLHLSSDDLHDCDLIALCDAISLSRIRMIDLKSNRITDLGAQILASNLPQHLERLWLLGNPMGIEGAQALKEKLEKDHVNLIDLRFPIYERFELISELDKLQEECRYFLLLNRGGRRILVEEQLDSNHHNFKTSHSNDPRLCHLRVPLGLWSLVLERANRINLAVPWYRASTSQSADLDRAEVLYFLLRNGSVLIQQRCS